VHMANALERSWYRHHGWSLLLLPLGAAYATAVAMRRWSYRQGWLKSRRLPVPVIVVGNITVGGNGKTPLTAWIAHHLHRRGLHVGIVSRGYGGRSSTYPLHVKPTTPAAVAGDEPVLLAARGDATVVVDPVRARGAHLLVEEYGVDVIVADDGLQHYALARDLEIAVIDGERGHGNGRLLPAGPLREPCSRLAGVDLQLEHGPHGDFQLVPDSVRPVRNCETCLPENLHALASFAGQRVHALAGIGAPQRFFDMLRRHDIDVIPHHFPDHHDFRSADIRFNDDLPVLMTEKDAVKCRARADRRHWYVPVRVALAPTSEQRLAALLETCLHQAAPTHGAQRA